MRLISSSVSGAAILFRPAVFSAYRSICLFQSAIRFVIYLFTFFWRFPEWGMLVGVFTLSHTNFDWISFTIRIGKPTNIYQNHWARLSMALSRLKLDYVLAFSLKWLSMALVSIAKVSPILPFFFLNATEKLLMKLCEPKDESIIHHQSGWVAVCVSVCVWEILIEFIRTAAEPSHGIASGCGSFIFVCVRVCLCGFSYNKARAIWPGLIYPTLLPIFMFAPGMPRNVLQPLALTAGWEFYACKHVKTD